MAFLAYRVRLMAKVIILYAKDAADMFAEHLWLHYASVEGNVQLGVCKAKLIIYFSHTRSRNYGNTIYITKYLIIIKNAHFNLQTNYNKSYILDCFSKAI